MASSSVNALEQQPPKIKVRMKSHSDAVVAMMDDAVLRVVVEEVVGVGLVLFGVEGLRRRGAGEDGMMAVLYSSDGAGDDRTGREVLER